MIQDRLTAKFLTVKPVNHADAKPYQPAAPKRETAPATDLYTRGRSLFGTFWL